MPIIAIAKPVFLWGSAKNQDPRVGAGAEKGGVGMLASPRLKITLTLGYWWNRSSTG